MNAYEPHKSHAMTSATGSRQSKQAVASHPIKPNQRHLLRRVASEPEAGSMAVKNTCRSCSKSSPTFRGTRSRANMYKKIKSKLDAPWTVVDGPRLNGNDSHRYENRHSTPTNNGGPRLAVARFSV